MAYTRINWEDLPSRNTPRNANNFNKMDSAIKDHDDMLLGNTAIEKIVAGSIEGKNLFDKDDVYKYNYGFNDSGEFSNTSFNIYNKIKVKPSTTYYISRTTTDAGYGFRIASYKADGTKINYYNNTTNANFSYTTPSETDYILISCASNGIDTNIQIEIGSTATDYVPYMKYGYNEDTNMGKLIVEKISGKNLFDSSTLVARDMTNNIADNKRATSRQKLYLKAGTYTFSTNLDLTTYSYSVSTVATPLPTPNYNLIYTSGYISTATITFTITSQQEGYFLLTLKKVDNSALTLNGVIGYEYQLEKGSQATSYQDFNTTQMGNIVVDDISCKNVFNMLDTSKFTYRYKGSSPYYQSFTKLTYSSNEIKAYGGGGNYTQGFIDVTGLKPNTQYTISYIIKENTLGFNPSMKLTQNGITDSNGNITIALNLSNDASSASTSKYVIYSNIQLEQGSEATSYTPYDTYANSESEIYSTNEIKIGRWINGKPLYRKVIAFGALQNNGETKINFDNTFVIQQFDVYVKNPSSNIKFKLPVAGSNYIGMFCNQIDHYIAVQTSSDRTGFTDNYVIIEYTKATDA